MFCVIGFLMHFCFSFWVAPKRLPFFVEPMNFVDLLSLIPWVAVWCFNLIPNELDIITARGKRMVVLIHESYSTFYIHYPVYQVVVVPIVVVVVNMLMLLLLMLLFLTLFVVEITNLISIVFMWSKFSLESISILTQYKKGTFSKTKSLNSTLDPSIPVYFGLFQSFPKTKSLNFSLYPSTSVYFALLWLRFFVVLRFLRFLPPSLRLLLRHSFSLLRLLALPFFFLFSFWLLSSLVLAAAKNNYHQFITIAR